MLRNTFALEFFLNFHRETERVIGLVVSLSLFLSIRSYVYFYRYMFIPRDKLHFHEGEVAMKGRRVGVLESKRYR